MTGRTPAMIRMSPAGWHGTSRVASTTTSTTPSPETNPNKPNGLLDATKLLYHDGLLQQKRQVDWYWPGTGSWAVPATPAISRCPPGLGTTSWTTVRHTSWTWANAPWALTPRTSVHHCRTINWRNWVKSWGCWRVIWNWPRWHTRVMVYIYCELIPIPAKVKV